MNEPGPVDELHEHAQAVDTGGQRARARRDRNRDGARRKKRTRLARLAALVIAPVFAATGQLADYGWKDAGLWAVDTASTNCLDTACNKVLPKTSPDIQLLQEARIRTPEDAAAATRRLRLAGWNAHVSLAKTTEAGRGSGGCAVAARRGTGITPISTDIIAPDLRHRLSAAHVSAIIPGGIHVISVYLKDSEGLTEYNLRVLQ